MVKMKPYASGWSGLEQYIICTFRPLHLFCSIIIPYLASSFNAFSPFPLPSSELISKTVIFKAPNATLDIHCNNFSLFRFQMKQSEQFLENISTLSVGGKKLVLQVCQASKSSPFELVKVMSGEATSKKRKVKISMILHGKDKFLADMSSERMSQILCRWLEVLSYVKKNPKIRWYILTSPVPILCTAQQMLYKILDMSA